MRNWLLLMPLTLPLPAVADAYPTTETVKHVMNCMLEFGGPSEENLYTCACRFDAIREQMSFAEYEAAVTYERYRDTPGKRGAVFRDPESAGTLRAKLRTVRAEAEKSCPRVVRIATPPSSRD